MQTRVELKAGQGYRASLAFGLLRRSDGKTISDDLLMKLSEVGVRSFGSSMPLDEVRKHIRESHHVFVGFDVEERPIAFGGSKYTIEEDTRMPCLYLSGAFVDPQSRKTGLYNALSLRRILHGLELGYRIVAVRTQNPKVEAGIVGALETLCAEKGISRYFLSNRTKVPGLYGRMLTDQRPISSIDRINAEYERLDYDRGDAFYLRFVLGVVA